MIFRRYFKWDFFGNSESKDEKKARKQAEAEAKQHEKDLAILRRFGVEDLSDPRDIESIRNILTELSGTGFIELGITLGAGNDRDIQKNLMYYQRAILEQNFIIIRQLDRIVKNLSEK